MKARERTSEMYSVSRSKLSIISSTLGVLLSICSALIAQDSHSIHPTFPFLDKNNRNVLSSGQAVSTMNSCGACHDTGYIESHSFHVDLGLREFGKSGKTKGGRPWDLSPGLFGKWSPNIYRTLAPKDEQQIDLGTADWVRIFGARHVGGGPAVRSRDGQRLTSLEISAADSETLSRNPETDELEAWDWQKSGLVEMNCFLCHLSNPNNEARITELQSGNFELGNTATLLGTGLVEKKEEGWRWNSTAFDQSGNVKSDFLTPQNPDDNNCGLCHGLTSVDRETPLVTNGCEPGYWSTETTGQIISPQRLMDSGVNLAGKKDLSRSWDIHSERLLECVDCHFSVNNPIYYQESEASRPAHLKFDARRMDLKDYLIRPSHQFAKGRASQAAGLNATIGSCESCHEATAIHDWLPYKERHFNALSCESCHIPKLHAPARQVYDWTVVTPEGKPRLECRGIEGEPGSSRALITGFEPVLLPRREVDGGTRLAPYNLITSWYWVHGETPRPVRLQDLQDIYLDEENYHQEVIALLDTNSDRTLSDDELVLNTAGKSDVIKKRLEALGLQNVRIMGEIEPFGIHHNVTHGDWALKECTACHSDESRVNRPFILSDHHPKGVEPRFVWANDIVLNGKIEEHGQGALVYKPASRSGSLFILGHDRIPWLHWAGFSSFILVMIGIVVHGGVRVVMARRNRPNHVSVKRVYMYTAYERFWHWLQALAIIALILTGLVIHSPLTFKFLDFESAVSIHNIVGFILLANAFLAAFYHIAGGQIQQYLPEPKGFFSQAIQQTIFYMRGIFKSEAHPFEKNPQKKLNPLQKITYLMILNVLLPVQVLSGIVIWGAQRWPSLTANLGGLPVLIPLHSLAAWLFAAFLIVHIYLTTTGHTPTSNIKAMIVGWDEVVLHKQNRSSK